MVTVSHVTWYFTPQWPFRIRAMLPYGASLDQVGDCFEAVWHTLLQLVIKLFEAEDLQLIARLDLADGDGEEALVNVVVAGLKAMNVSLVVSSYRKPNSVVLA